MYSLSCLNILLIFFSLYGNSNKAFPLGANTVKLVIFKEDILSWFFMLVLFLC